MEKITQAERNLFNPYKNVSLIFKKKLQDKNNAYIRFDSEISFDKESFSEENFEQTVEVSIDDMDGNPLEHRNDLHPLANRAMQNCKLNLVMFTGGAESKSGNPQSISFTKKESGYRAFLYEKGKEFGLFKCFFERHGSEY